jgi:membrane associated rhomboid family serine protease
MLPLVFGHEARTRRWPYVTICLIGLNVLVFAFEVSVRQRLFPFLQEWGLVPARVQAEVTAHNMATVVSSEFMHGDFFHLFFNMWFLYVFGDSLEDALGHWWYLFLYLVAGFFGNMVFIATSGGSPYPVIGASGAIAGVMGASLVIWPTARLRVPGFVLGFFAFGLVLTLGNLVTGGLGFLFLLPALLVTLALMGYLVHEAGSIPGGLFRFFGTPAWAVLGMFLLLNVWEGAAAIVDPRLAGNVAVWAHVGGFAVGALFGALFPKSPVQLRRRRELA